MLGTYILIQIHIIPNSNVNTMQQFWLGTISFCMPIYLLTNMHTDEAIIHMITGSVAIVTGRHTEYIARSEGYNGISRSCARDTLVYHWVSHTQDDVMTWKAFLHSWIFVRGIHQSLVDSPHKWTGMRSVDVLFDVNLTKFLKKWPSFQWLQMSWCSCDFIVIKDQKW